MNPRIRLHSKSNQCTRCRVIKLHCCGGIIVPPPPNRMHSNVQCSDNWQCSLEREPNPQPSRENAEQQQQHRTKAQPVNNPLDLESIPNYTQSKVYVCWKLVGRSRSGLWTLLDVCRSFEHVFGSAQLSWTAAVNGLGQRWINIKIGFPLHS